MPTISPPRTARDRAGIVERVQLVQLKPHLAYISYASRLNGQFFGADHHPRHAVRREISNSAVARQLSATKNRNLVGKRHHLAEFVRDHQNRQVAVDHHGAQHAQNFVGFARR